MIYEVLFYLSKKIFLPEVESKQGKKDRAWPVATLFSETFTDSFRFGVASIKFKPVHNYSPVPNPS